MTLFSAAAPSAAVRSEDALPFVPLDEGGSLQLLQVDLTNGLWIVRIRWPAGVLLQTHKHTGTVFAFTLSGRWHYLESPEINTAGSYLFEPAGSVHTLAVPADNTGITEVWFAVHGANLNLDSEGNVESVTDAETMLRSYRSRCRKMGVGEPPVILA
jgi:2,4'-dihydroxyacetophenone dioxygenase